MTCFETIRDLVRIIRSGNLVEQRATAVRRMGESLICAADLMEPAPMAAAAPGSIPESVGACADWLHEHLEAPSDTPEGASEIAAANPLVWLVVRKLIKLLVEELL